MSTRILTVEDDERIRTAVKLALEDEGWEVVEADTGEAAIDAFRTNPTDVVLIDIMLPGVDGFEVCRAVRRQSDVPIIMVTARADTHDVVAGLESGAVVVVRGDQVRVLQVSGRPVRSVAVDDGLLAAGTAYHCYCAKEELDAMRAEQQEQKRKPRYDGRCRHGRGPGADSGRAPVVRFKNPEAGSTIVHDIVHGDVEFQNVELDDLIIARSDGTPTYNFCVVVDDADMGVTDVIRGDDHLNNTPRQLNMLLALGHTAPVYAHVPMIL